MGKFAFATPNIAQSPAVVPSARYIDFTIPGQPNLKVHMEERPDGSIFATLQMDAGTKADLRGLFFDVRDSSLIPHLRASGPQLTQATFKDEGVIDLGQGANLNGGGRKPFDAGLEFGTPGKGKDIVQSTYFVLTSTVGGLTLDDLALVQFGVRMTGGGSPSKNVFIAPAAPDAINDSVSVKEDETAVFSVLANDTDEDGTGEFRIVWVSDPVHGTATISADGKSIIYVSDLNYSGADSFTYSMIDGHGGGDSATAAVAVIAVADAPTLSLTTAPGANVNEILLTVSAAVTDTDGSEYLDRFTFAGLPAGATIVGEGDLVYDPTSTTQTLSRTFTVELTPNTDFNFGLAVTAIARELSNLDEEPTTRTQTVLIDSNSNSFSLTFEAVDRACGAAATPSSSRTTASWGSTSIPAIRVGMAASSKPGRESR